MVVLAPCSAATIAGPPTLLARSFGTGVVTFTLTTFSPTSRSNSKVPGVLGSASARGWSFTSRYSTITFGSLGVTPTVTRETSSSSVTV